MPTKILYYRHVHTIYDTYSIYQGSRTNHFFFAWTLISLHLTQLSKLCSPTIPTPWSCLVLSCLLFPLSLCTNCGSSSFLGVRFHCNWREGERMQQSPSMIPVMPSYPSNSITTEQIQKVLLIAPSVLLWFPCYFS